MKLPFSMVPSGSGAAGFIAGIIVIALVAFAIKQAVTPPAASNNNGRGYP